MFTLIWKQTLARRGRLALTAVAVTLGVAFVVGALVLTDTSQKVFDEQFATAASGVDLTVRDAATFDSAMGVEVERDPLPSGVVDDVAALDGVARVEPVVRGSGLLIHEGEAIVPRGPSMLSSWVPDRLNGFSLRTGRAPQQRDEVVIDRATAREKGIRLGDILTVQAGTSQQMQVVGLVGFGTHDGLPNTTVALVTVPAARTLLELGDVYSEVLVVADRDTATGDLRTRVAEDLGDGYDVGTSQDTAAASAAAAKNQLGYLRVTLFVLAGAALLIGGFLIANTFAIVVSQRTRELALLRAAGATGRQVFSSVLGEALVVGAVGSAAGAVAGVGAAAGLRDLAGGIGIPLPDSALVLEPRTLATGFAIGVAVTVLAALGPSRRAARTAPVEAMRTGDTTQHTSRRRTVGGLVVLTFAAASAWFGLGADGPVVLAAAAGALGLVALVMLGPALAPRLARVVGAPLRRLGVPGQLAAQSAARAPRRTAATVTALALSLGLIVFMGVLATSIKASVASTYTEVISADFVIESGRGEMLGGLVPSVYRAVEDLPEVGVVSRLKYGHWKDGDTSRALTAIDPATLARVTDVDMVEGALRNLDGGGIVLSEQVAADRGVGVGDRFRMTFAKDGTRGLEVVGLVDDTDAQALSTDYLISLGTYRDLFAERMDASLYVGTADGVTGRAAEAALEDALAATPTAQLRDQQAAVDGRMLTVDQILGLVTVLLMFTVLIALLGITNTLALSIVERTREIGLLRAVGMTRGQLTGMIRGEAMLVAALAFVLALGLGTGMGAAAVRVLARNADVSMRVPYGQLLVVLVAATVTGLVAGLFPARRAARTDVLAAMATE